MNLRENRNICITNLLNICNNLYLYKIIFLIRGEKNYNRFTSSVTNTLFKLFYFKTGNNFDRLVS